MDLTSVATAIGKLLALGSFMYGCIRVGMVAGRTDGRLSALTDGLDRVTSSLERFIEKADERLNDHAERLGRHDERIGALERVRSSYGRRAADRPED